MKQVKYYRVIAHRAHQGTKRSVPITFYIAAENAYHASTIARNMPGIKHHRSVMSCVPISSKEYYEGRKVSAYKRFC